MPQYSLKYREADAIPSTSCINFSEPVAAYLSQLLVLHSLLFNNNVPKPTGLGGILFLVPIRQHLRPRSSFSVRYFLNRLMDFDQICIDTFLVKWEEYIKFW